MMEADDLQLPHKNDVIEFAQEGDVVFRYRSFWGTPKFIVAIDDGSLKSVAMEKCHIVKKGQESGKEAENEGK